MSTEAVVEYIPRQNAEAGLAFYAQECLDDSVAWFPQVVGDLYHHALSMSGEMGELCNVIKKVQRGDFGFDEPDPKCPGLTKIESEAADVFIYLMNFCGDMGVDLAKSYNLKRRHNAERFAPESREPSVGRGYRALGVAPEVDS